MSLNFSKNTPWLWLFVVLAATILLIALRFPALQLPHYWDEAFPYSYAIGYMSEHSPGLLTTAAPTEFTRGHPLLYAFLQASWNTLVGEQLWLQRLLPLLISAACLWLVFLIGRLVYNSQVAAGAVVLLTCQSTFLAQATFQLPEMLMSFWLLCSLYFLLTGRMWLFSLAATAMLLTKEPAMVLLFIVFVFQWLTKLHGATWSARFKVAGFYAFPVLLAGSFYVHQYLIQGWFLFPEHTGLMQFNLGAFLDQFSRYFSHLTIYDGRNALLFTALIFTTIYFWRQRKNLRTGDYARNSMLFGFLILGFLVFSSINFYSNRYILCLFPLFALLVSSALFFTHSSRWLHATVVVALASVSLWFSTHPRNTNDHSLGYADAVTCQQQAIDYCTKRGWQHESIHTGFLMHKYLTSHYPRYLQQRDVFTQVNTTTPEQASIFLLCSNENYLRQHPALAEFELVKSFSSGIATCEILARKPQSLQ